MDDPRFPIGPFELADGSTRIERIEDIERLPERLRKAVKGLTDEQLDTRYRPGGWTLRQTVHHLADSHMNSYCRFKIALTEEGSPTIRPYMEDRWAELADSLMPIEISLGILDGVHVRWAELLKSMTGEDFSRTFTHPESGVWKLENALALYAWHSRHHTAHITSTRERHGW